MSDASNKGGFTDVERNATWEEMVRRCNSRGDGGNGASYGVELDRGRDLALELGTGEQVVLSRLLSELGNR